VTRSGSIISLTSLGGQVARWSSQTMLPRRFELPPLDLRIYNTSFGRMDNTNVGPDLSLYGRVRRTLRHWPTAVKR